MPGADREDGMRFGTESGTVYEVLGERVCRAVAGDAEAMRRDGEWLDLLMAPHVVVGQPASFILEPLGEGDVTMRQTSQVTWVEP